MIGRADEDNDCSSLRMDTNYCENHADKADHSGRKYYDRRFERTRNAFGILEFAEENF